MPKTTLNDLQKIIEERDAKISALESELNRFKKDFQSLKILVDMLSGEKNGV